MTAVDIASRDVITLPLWDRYADHPPWPDEARPVWWRVDQAANTALGIQLLSLLPDGAHIAKRFAAECVVHVNNRAAPRGVAKRWPRDVRFPQVVQMVDIAGAWGLKERSWQRKRLTQLVMEAYPTPH